VLQAMRTNLDGDLEESERLAAEALELGDRLGMVDAQAIFALQLFLEYPMTEQIFVAHPIGRDRF